MPFEKKQRDFDDTNTGTLEANKKFGQMTSTGRPDDRDFTGKININGRWYWLSGKKRESNLGKFISLKVRPKEDKPKTYNRAEQEDRRVMAGDDFL